MRKGRNEKSGSETLKENTSCKERSVEEMRGVGAVLWTSQWLELQSGAPPPPPPPPPVLCVSLFLPRALSQWCCLIIWPGAEQKRTEREKIAAHWAERETEAELSFSPRLAYFTYKLWLFKPKTKPDSWTDLYLFFHHQLPPLLFKKLLRLPLWD